MKYWYDIICVPESDKEILMPMCSQPALSDFDDCYPVHIGMIGNVYFNTEIGAVMVNSAYDNLEGKTIEVVVK